MMSEYSDRLARDYIHKACGVATTVSGDHYVMLECAFRRVDATYCATCETFVPLDQVAWADSGQLISAYRAEIAAGVSFTERMRLSVLGNAYEGALRLNLDAKGNPKSGVPPKPAAAEVIAATPVPKEHADTVAAMAELTAALAECVPGQVGKIECEIRRAPEGAPRPLAYTITSPDAAGKRFDPTPRVDRAGSRVVRLLSPSLRSFPGLTVTMEKQDDGRWRNNVKLH